MTHSHIPAAIAVLGKTSCSDPAVPHTRIQWWLLPVAYQRRSEASHHVVNAPLLSGSARRIRSCRKRREIGDNSNQVETHTVLVGSPGSGH